MTVSIQTDRQVRILATNGTDESIAFVLNNAEDRQRERCRAYYEKNKTALIEYTRNYYANNRQTILAKAKAYNAKEENKQRRRAYSKQYWINNNKD